LCVLSTAACGASSDDPAPGSGAVAAGAAGAAPGGGARGGEAGGPSSGAGAAGAAGAALTNSVEVIAGSSVTGWADGVGTAVRFNRPTDGALSADGSTLYVVDTFSAVLRRVDLATGRTTTVAGQPYAQETVDGVGPAAHFTKPRAVAVAPDGGSLYVSDASTIRRVDLADYAVTTVAGAPGQNAYADGFGAAARLGGLLHHLEFSADGATIYVADRTNRVVRTLAPATGEVRTLVGSVYDEGETLHVDGVGAAARFSDLGGLARVGRDLYVADTFNHVVRRVDLESLAVTTVAGVPGDPGLNDGPAATARFDTPQGLAAHRGFLYSTSFDGVLRRISLADFSVATVLGVAADARAVDGTGPTARLGRPFAPALSHPTDDALIYLDRGGGSVRRIDLPAFKVTTLVGPKDPQGTRDGTLGEARFNAPAGLAATADGSTWYVTDLVDHVVRRVDVAAGKVDTLAGRAGEFGTADGPLDAARFDAPAALALDEAARRLYVIDRGSFCLREIDLGTGTVATLAGRPGVKGADDGPADRATFAGPLALALDAAGGRLFVVERADGDEEPFPNGFAGVRVVDLAAHAVSTLVGGEPAFPPVDGPFATARLGVPSSVAFDPAGQRLFLGDDGLSTLHVVDLGARTVAALAGRNEEVGSDDGPFADARFDTPGGLAWSAAESALYVTDVSTVRRLDFASQTVSTWLGDAKRNGGVGSAPVSFADATLFEPFAPVIAGGALGFLSEFGLYRARPPVALER
jgi:sugar lactone lactonase YvrE